VVENLDEELLKPTDKRIFAIANSFHKGYTVDKIWEMTRIDRWFLTRLYYLFQMENQLSYVH
jgi:carbamoyl-phosphate synthase/aspartate carbamoyltransferase